MWRLGFHFMLPLDQRLPPAPKSTKGGRDCFDEAKGRHRATWKNTKRVTTTPLSLVKVHIADISAFFTRIDLKEILQM